MTSALHFETLPDHAILRVFPVEGGLADAEAGPFLGVLNALLEQWRDKGAIISGGAALVEAAHFILVAYEPASGDLSGCTKDGLTHMVADFEKRLGKRILAAPRFAVAEGHGARFLGQREFREAAARGDIGTRTRVFDHLIGTVGELRAGRFDTTVGASWYARALPPA